MNRAMQASALFSNGEQSNEFEEEAEARRLSGSHGSNGSIVC